jgi:insulysin
LPVGHDVAAIETLTKAEMLEFVDQYISPASPHRAKLSVHLLAQTSPSEIAAHTSPAERLEKLKELIIEFLEEEDLPVDEDKLKARVQTPGLLEGGADSIAAAIGKYLSEDAGLPAEEVEELLVKGKPMLSSVLASVGIQTAVMLDDKAPAVKDALPAPTKIEDVTEFKRGLQPSIGSIPVTEINKFENLEAKP